MNEPGTNPDMEKKCPQCGALLPSGVLEGLCPACLLKQGAAADTAGPAAVAQQAPTGSSQSSPAESPPTAPPSPATIPAPLAQTANQPPPPVVTPAALPAPTPGPVQAMSVPDPPKALPAPPPAQTPPSATPPAAVADAPTSPTPKDPAAQDLAALTPPAPSTLPAPAPAPAPAQMPAVDPPPARSHIVLRANSDTWVEVRNRQGGMLLSRTLHSGDSWSVPDQGSLMLSTGNAGGLEVLIDGGRAPSLGASGAVRRDVPLDADLLRAGRPAPEPSTRARPSTASR